MKLYPFVHLVYVPGDPRWAAKYYVGPCRICPYEKQIGTTASHSWGNALVFATSLGGKVVIENGHFVVKPKV